MMMLSLRGMTLVMTCVRMLRFTRHYKRYYSREIDDFSIILFQIYQGTHLPKIIKIELGLTKLLQKNKLVQFFLTHSVLYMDNSLLLMM